MKEDKNKQTTNIRAIILTGFVSLAVGVGSGLLINFLTEKRPKLTYDITTQEVFQGEQNRLGIFAVRILNDGAREIEEVLCNIQFKDGTVTERRVGGIPESARNISSGGDRNVEVSVPFLNPEEQFSLQVLLEVDEESLLRPGIDVRGKGVVGTQANADKDGSLSDVFATTIAAAAALLTAMTAFLSRRMRRRLDLYRVSEDEDDFIQHNADQRDTVAFALDSYGLNRDADTVRESLRKLSYWAASDLLRRNWISNGDEETIRMGLEALAFLQEYASIAPSSRRIIQVNMASLALALGDREKAKSLLQSVSKSEDPIIAKRIEADTDLRSCYGELSG